VPAGNTRTLEIKSVWRGRTIAAGSVVTFRIDDGSVLEGRLAGRTIRRRRALMVRTLR